MQRLLKSTRLWGLIGTGVVLWFLLFVVFGKVDMSWIMPDTDRMARNLIHDWPQMPFFTVEREPATNSVDGSTTSGEWVYYTVPTHQFSARDLTRMGVTNSVIHPARPK